MIVYMATRLVRHVPGLVNMDGAPDGCVGVFLVFSSPSVAKGLLGPDTPIFEMESEGEPGVTGPAARKPEREGNVVDMWQWRKRKGK